MRYTHQGSEVTVAFTESQVTVETIRKAIQEFHTHHQHLYGFALEQPVEVVTLRVSASGNVGSVNMPELPSGLMAPELAIASQRQVFFNETNGFVPCNIYDRDRLASGSIINGPAILEGMDSTVLINPGWTGHIDEYGNCIMEPI